MNTILKEQINQQLEGLNERDLRFFRTAEFSRMALRAEEFANSCPVCRRHQDQINEILPHLRNAILTPGRDRRKLDQVSSAIALHQRKTHGYFPPYYHNYLYSFAGTVAGALIGFLIALLVNSQNLWFFIVPCLIAGLLAGQVTGGKKDATIRARKKIL